MLASPITTAKTETVVLFYNNGFVCVVVVEKFVHFQQTVSGRVFMFESPNAVMPQLRLFVPSFVPQTPQNNTVELSVLGEIIKRNLFIITFAWIIQTFGADILVLL